MNHMHMDDGGTPWLTEPVMLHSSRESSCSLDTQEQCEWQRGHWRFWYEADHVFALPTIAFFMVAIVLFSFAYLLSTLIFRNGTLSRPTARIVALNRYLTQRSFRINGLNWNSAPLGVLILGGVGAIFFFAMTLGPRPYYWPNTRELSFGNSPPLATRTGYMALGCLPFVFATSPKSNMITAFTGVSHEKLQVFHRWISYAMFVLALIHTFPFIIFHIWKGDMVSQWNTSVFYWTGVVALLAQAYLTFASVSPLRNMCYEWFKFSHFVAALVFILFFFFHCNFRLSSWDYFIATAVIYSLCWLHRQIQMFVSNGIATGVVDLTPNGFIRVVVPTKTTWTAGQHYFVRFLSLGRHSLSTHPFTVCSLPSSRPGNAGKSELVFYIRPQGGFTSALARHTEANPGFTTTVLLDGPYGGTNLQQIARSHRLILVAGGSGAGWLLPMVETFLRQSRSTFQRYSSDSDGSKIEKSERRTARVILATRDLATEQWFTAAINELLEKYSIDNTTSLLEIEVHQTAGVHETDFNASMRQPSGEKDELNVGLSDRQSSPDSEQPTANTARTKDYLRGRPNLPAIIEREAKAGRSSIGVFACGPLSMQSDLSNAVAKQQIDIMKDGSREMYLHMEHFSWA